MSVRSYDATTAAIRCDGGCGAELSRVIDPTDPRWRKQLRTQAKEAGWITRRTRNGRHRDFCEDCR